MEIRTVEKPAMPAALNGHNPGTYSPVTVQQEDTIGAIFLGIITVTLLIAFFRSEARNRALMAKFSPAP
jgi:hypothetical protein